MTRPSPRPRPGPRGDPGVAPQVGPPAAAPTAASGRVTGGRAESFGWVGAVCIVAGAVALALALLHLAWFDSSAGAGRNDFANLHRAVQHGSSVGLIAKLFFGTLAWPLAVVSVLLALGACVPGRASLALRVFGAVAALGGDALAVLGIRIYTLPGASYSFFLQRVTSGFWTAAIGFLLVGIGATIGPRRAGDPLT